MNCLIFLPALFLIVNVESFNGFLSGGANSRALNRYLEMKKRGDKVPIQQRGEFLKRQQMIEKREQYQKEAPSGEEVPVFEVFMRPRVIS